MIEDVFLHRLIQMVYTWYNEWYAPEKMYHKHRPMVNASIEAAKEEHIKELIKHYDKERFENCNNLYEERIKFLTEVQHIVDTLRGD